MKKKATCLVLALVVLVSTATITTVQAAQTWQQAYADVLHGQIDVGNQDWFWYLFDINQDGVPELIIWEGPGQDAAVYTFANGAAILLEAIPWPAWGAFQANLGNLIANLYRINEDYINEILDITSGSEVTSDAEPAPLPTELEPQILAAIETFSDIVDTATAVQAVENLLAFADDPGVIAHGLIELYAEHAISAAARVIVEDDQIVLDRAAVEQLEATAMQARAEIEAMFAAEGYQARRRLNTAISFVAPDADRIEIQMQPDAFVNVEQVFVTTPYFELIFPPSFIENESVPVTVSAGTTNSYFVELSRDISETIRLSVPTIAGNPRYQTLVDSSGEIIGGRENPVTGRLEARISHGGTFTVVENRIDFTDIQHLSREMQDAIRILASQGMVEGTGGGNFSPEDSVNRAQLATMIMRMLAQLDPNADGGFNDVLPTDWFFGAAGSASRHSVMGGTGGGNFSPNNNLPRDQLTVVVARVLHNEMGYAMPANPGQYLQNFQDRDAIADWSVNELALATRENLVVLRADGQFRPGDTMTRSDVALMLHRLYLLLW